MTLFLMIVAIPVLMTTMIITMTIVLMIGFLISARYEVRFGPPVLQDATRIVFGTGS